MRRITYTAFAVVFGVIVTSVIFLYHSTHRIPLTWERVAEKEDWGKRDAAIALVHNGQMWLMGGWPGLGVPMLTDIWSSSDGLEWKQVSASAHWKHGGDAMAASFKGRMWVLGGVSDPRLADESYGNEIWSSADGQAWDYHGTAPWSPRAGAALVVFAERLWLLGGHAGLTYLNEVWSSSDGVNWTQAPSPPWHARAFHTAVSFNGRLWLMAGGVWDVNPILLNDIWASSDGVRWEQITDHARWKGRLWSKAVVYENEIWLIGGYRGLDLDSRSIWRSADGQTWERVKATIDFKRRHAAAIFNFSGRIWIAGGYEGGRDCCGNDVWAVQFASR
jgi:hypothetical protein